MVLLSTGGSTQLAPRTAAGDGCSISPGRMTQKQQVFCLYMSLPLLWCPELASAIRRQAHLSCCAGAEIKCPKGERH